MFSTRFRVKSNAFQLLATLIAAEAFRMEATPRCADNPTRDGERAMCTLCAGADGGWCPVGAGGGGGRTAGLG